jgi:hypothetical protein
LVYWKDGNRCTSYLKKVEGGKGGVGEEGEGGKGGGGMGEDEEEDCKTWQKSSGNTTLLWRELR